MGDETTRVCRKCQRAQPITDFYMYLAYAKGKAYRGRRRTCITCQGRARNPRTLTRDMATLTCRQCGHEKPAEAFPTFKSPSGYVGRRRTCRACDQERNAEFQRKYRELYPWRKKEHTRAWRERNPERARKLGCESTRRHQARKLGAAVVEVIDRDYVYERDGGKCHICGGRVSRSSFTLDHLVPLAHGGNHSYANLRVAHGSCNSRRGAGRLPAQLLLVG